MQERASAAGESTATAWRLRDVAWASLLALVLFGGAGLMAVRVARGGATAGARQVQGAVVALSELAFVAAAWAFSVRRHRASWRDLGVRGFNPLGSCMAVMASLSLALSASLVWGLLLRELRWPTQPSVLPFFGRGPVGVALAFLGTVVIAPFAEELFFRGFMFAALRGRLGLWAGMAVDAALFAALHLTPTVFPVIFLMGILFCLLYQFSGSIWPGTLLHACINLLALAAAFLLA